jgi:hypothetical protein
MIYPTRNCQDPIKGILSGSIKNIATKKEVKNTNQKVGIKIFKNIVMLFETLLNRSDQVVLV